MMDENIYLFTGTADIFIANRIQRILSSFEKETIAINKYDMEQTSLITVLEDACTIPFLEDYKVIILRNPKFLADKMDLTKEVKAFCNYLKKPNDTTLLIIDACNINLNKSNEIVKALNNFARIIDYSDSLEVEIKGWIKMRCTNRQIEISDEAIDLFLEYINSDQVRMVNELEKLMDYVSNEKSITTDTVKLLVTKDLSKEIFNLIKAITEKDLAGTNQIFQTLASQTKDISGVIAMISNSFKDFLTISKLLSYGYTQTDIARLFNISSSRAYYRIKEAKSFNISDLEEYVKKLALLDYKIKSGQIDKNIGIELILLQLNK